MHRPLARLHEPSDDGEQHLERHRARRPGKDAIQKTRHHYPPTQSIGAPRKARHAVCRRRRQQQPVIGARRSHFVVDSGLDRAERDRTHTNAFAGALRAYGRCQRKNIGLTGKIRCLPRARSKGGKGGKIHDAASRPRTHPR